jgi:hypothetical protein
VLKGPKANNCLRRAFHGGFVSLWGSPIGSRRSDTAEARCHGRPDQPPNVIRLSTVAAKRHNDARPKAAEQAFEFLLAHACSALAELKAPAGLGLAVFLAFYRARVPRQEPRDLQDATQFRLVEGQRSADAMADSTGLA